MNAAKMSAIISRYYTIKIWCMDVSCMQALDTAWDLDGELYIGSQKSYTDWCILTLINLKHIKPQFFEDARDIVLEFVRNIMEIYDNVKINTVFNDEFVMKNANESNITRNYELFYSILFGFARVV